MGRGIAILAMAACLAVTGCGYPKLEKPEKAFCKAENRVIPDDELMARALLAIRNTPDSKYGKDDLPAEIELYVTQNISANPSNQQVKSALLKYVRLHQDRFGFDYDPERIVNVGMSQLPQDYDDRAGSNRKYRYYGDLMYKAYNENSKPIDAAVFTCATIMFYNYG